MRRKLIVEVDVDPNEPDSLLKLVMLLAEWLEKQKEDKAILKYGIGLEIDARLLLSGDVDSDRDAEIDIT